MLISAAVCPHPPILVPELAGGAAPELDELRAACDEAVGRLLSVPADLLIVVGAAEQTRAYGRGAYATLRPYGLDWTAGRDGAGREEALPLSLTIGYWLLRRHDAQTRARFQGVSSEAASGECLRLGEELARSAGRVALLVMGDGSACRSEKAPGYLDERAEPYDAAVAAALGNADAAALAGLEAGLSRELQAAGRAAWQVLAGAAGTGGGLGGELLAAEAPYGVGYFAAAWSRRV
ncbi:hypothetical protein [Spirillospora albida]|uniref:hypothetical protein n=1 Tax=Spirillospora albida TaxID=58123 RepID=UPI0004C216C6|nr:hypothetical protein [Spirillospora albida]